MTQRVLDNIILSTARIFFENIINVKCKNKNDDALKWRYKP